MPMRDAGTIFFAASFAALVVVQPIAPAIAHAQPCANAEDRLAVVRQRLRADAKDARVWAWGWGLGFTALAVGQAGLAVTRSDRGQRADLYVGAGKSVLGLVPILFVPVPAVRDADVFDGHLTAAATAPDQRCALLAEGDGLLARSADDEAFAGGWLAHAANVAVNGGGLLIVGLGYRRWATGAVGALIGTAIGEVQVFTRPTSALRGRRSDQGRWALAPLLDRDAVGIRLAGIFDR
ncbi:MAG TPA: hypothetical protein VGL59_19575 [Polyangia bacterium]